MQASKWPLGTSSNDEDDVAQYESPEDVVDRFGFNVSLLVLFIALIIAAAGVVSYPNFGKCSALENLTERNACYDELRDELLKPPAKGASVIISH